MNLVSLARGKISSFVRWYWANVMRDIFSLTSLALKSFSDSHEGFGWNPFSWFLRFRMTWPHRKLHFDDNERSQKEKLRRKIRNQITTSIAWCTSLGETFQSSRGRKLVLSRRASIFLSSNFHVAGSYASIVKKSIRVSFNDLLTSLNSPATSTSTLHYYLYAKVSLWTIRDVFMQNFYVVLATRRGAWATIKFHHSCASVSWKSISSFKDLSFR